MRDEVNTNTAAVFHNVSNKFLQLAVNGQVDFKALAKRELDRRKKKSVKNKPHIKTSVFDSDAEAYEELQRRKKDSHLPILDSTHHIGIFINVPEHAAPFQTKVSHETVDAYKDKYFVGTEQQFKNFIKGLTDHK